jgi:hypothetical protein
MARQTHPIMETYLQSVRFDNNRCAREKMPFEVAPVNPYLTRMDENGKVISSAKAKGE